MAVVDVVGCTLLPRSGILELLLIPRSLVSVDNSGCSGRTSEEGTVLATLPEQKVDVEVIQVWQPQVAVCQAVIH